eukprot:3378557-Prymnesium_polylepis.3
MGSCPSRVSPSSTWRLSGPILDEAEQKKLDGLKTMDERLVRVLRTGHVRILRVAWLLQQRKAWRVVSRQQLEVHEARGARPFLTGDEAVALLEGGRRQLGVLSYGWLKQSDPDPNGDHLRCVLRFLRASAGGQPVRGLFWDCCSLCTLPGLELSVHTR